MNIREDEDDLKENPCYAKTSYRYGNSRFRQRVRFVRCGSEEASFDDTSQLLLAKRRHFLASQTQVHVRETRGRIIDSH